MPAAPPKGELAGGWPIADAVLLWRCIFIASRWWSAGAPEAGCQPKE